MKFIQLNAKLKEGLLPVYVAEGDDAYFRDCAAAAVKNACKIGQPLLNEVSFSGDTLRGDALLDFLAGLNTPPLFDDYRFVRVNGFYPSEADGEKIRAYAERPCPTTVLVIVNPVKKATGAGAKKKSADWKKMAGVCYIDCAKESEETLEKWLFAMMRGKKLVPDADAVTTMVRYCVQDAARLKSETEKLVALLGEGGKVTRKVVEEVVPKDAEYKIYELTQAASRRNFREFAEILEDLMVKGFDEIALLSSLTSHYRTLSEILALRGSDREISEKLGMKPYAVTRNREAARALGEERVREIYLRLYELSSGAKGGVFNKSGAFVAALGRIFFG